MVDGPGPETERAAGYLDRAEDIIAKERAQINAHIADRVGVGSVPSSWVVKEATRSSEVTLDNIEHVMRYQPWGRTQHDAGDQVREALTLAAKTILRVVPAGVSRRQAIEMIRMARTLANQGISFGGGL